MIILHEVAPSKDDKFNGLTLRHPQPAYTRSTSPLPDYDTSEAQQREITKSSPSKFKLKFDAKTWRIALYALGIYIALTVIIATPIIVVAVLNSKKSNHNATGYSPPPVPGWPEYNNPLPPYKMDLASMPSTQKTCNNWQINPNSPNSVITSFQLPPTGNIIIRSNATYESTNLGQLNGTLSVSMNGFSNTSSILFTVEMRSSSKNIRDQTNVCFCGQGTNRGLSIFIPSNIGDNTLTFNINVLLPMVNSQINNFATYLPMFSQVFGDLRQYLSFDQFSLQGSSLPIYCEFLQAFQISVTNVMAPIQGSFNVTDTLSLDSIKGPILADIMLSPRPVQIRPTVLQLSTGDSAVNASITLNPQTTMSISPPSPAFIAQVFNFNGPLQLDVAYDNISLNSSSYTLQLQVQNSAAQSAVNVGSVFEGCFNLQTKLSRAFVNNIVDSETNRTLYYDMETLQKAVGWVGSGRKPTSLQVACESFVDIISALGPVNVTFGL